MSGIVLGADDTHYEMDVDRAFISPAQWDNVPRLPRGIYRVEKWRVERVVR